jgi:outer membrane protein OmpA-like peptidoglycan-associated protein
MKIDAEPGRAGDSGAEGFGSGCLPIVVPLRRGPGRSGARAFLRICACASLAWIVPAATVAAQDTVIIGGGTGGAPRGPAIIGGGGSNLVINENVLDSLGAGPAPALPYSPPSAAQGGSAAAAVTPSAPGTAYRLPGTGQLVVSRPSTLLFPPPQFPRSTLTVAPAPAASQGEAMAPAAQAAPVEPVSEQEIAETAPAPAPTPEPEVQAAPEPEPGLEEEQVATAPASEPEPEVAAPAQNAAPSVSQEAALPAPDAGPEDTRVVFGADSAELSPAARDQLETLALLLMEYGTERVQLLAYARSSAEGPSRARRLSLSRALAVRAFLIDFGVPSSRLDVRAMGDKIQDGPPDRVDVLPQDSR